MGVAWESAKLLSGLEVGPYTLVELLGQGAFSQVWLAESSGEEGPYPVAVKLPTREPLAGWFSTRLGGLVGVEHPRIVRTIDLCKDGTGPGWIASEYHCLPDLRRFLLERTPFSPGRALRIILSLLEVLESLHQVGRSHGALKTKNLLFGPGDTILITDVDVGQGTREATLQSYQNEENRLAPSLRGLLPFLDPDDPDPGRPAGPADDVFAVGVVFHELVTGRLPARVEPNVWSEEQVPANLVPILQRIFGPRDGRPGDAMELARTLRSVSLETGVNVELGSVVSDSDHILIPVDSATIGDGGEWGEEADRSQGNEDDLVRLPEDFPGPGSGDRSPDPRPELPLEAPGRFGPRGESRQIERRFVRRDHHSGESVLVETRRGYVERTGRGPLVFPVVVFREAGWALGAVGLAVALVAIFHPGGHIERWLIPSGGRPEWYLLPAYQLLNWFDRAGSPAWLLPAAMSVGMFLLLCLPLWERTRPRPWFRRFFAVPLVLACLGATIGLGLWGSFEPAPVFGQAGERVVLLSGVLGFALGVLTLVVGRRRQ